MCSVAVFFLIPVSNDCAAQGDKEIYPNVFSQAKSPGERYESSPVDLENRRKRQEEMIAQKAGKEKLISGEPENSGGAVEPYDKKQQYFPEEKRITVAPEHSSPGKDIDIKDVATSVGYVQMIKEKTYDGARVYDRISKKMLSLKARFSEKDILINTAELPDTMLANIKKLEDIEGVEIKIPGADYAIITTFKVDPSTSYEINDEIFTIDRIMLKKNSSGKFMLHFPKGVLRDFNERKLCLVKDGDLPNALEAGNIKSLALILAKWAKFSKAGFDFDSESASKVARSVIKILGLGGDNTSVRVFFEVDGDTKNSRELFFVTLKNILSGDEEAGKRIYDLIQLTPAE